MFVYYVSSISCDILQCRLEPNKVELMFHILKLSLSLNSELINSTRLITTLFSISLSLILYLTSSHSIVDPKFTHTHTQTHNLMLCFYSLIISYLIDRLLDLNFLSWILIRGSSYLTQLIYKSIFHTNILTILY